MPSGRADQHQPPKRPHNGRVNKVNATTEAAATPTITTHRNTASSETFIYPRTPEDAEEAPI